MNVSVFLQKQALQRSVAQHGNYFCTVGFLDAANLYHPDERRLSETKYTPPCTAQFTIVNSGLHCSLFYSFYSSMRTSKIVTLNDWKRNKAIALNKSILNNLKINFTHSYTLWIIV